MAWLLYYALDKDYHGHGIYVLIFICGSMLGVVDELEQGLHPKRFYGWSDMAVNSSSMLIGIFTIVGLKKRDSSTWAWRKYLSEYRRFLWLILFGVAGAVVMCIHLFDVQTNEIFHGVYPTWVLVWNYLFLIATLVIFAFEIRSHISNRMPVSDGKKSLRRTTQLWAYLPLVILFFMHSLVVYVSLSGVSFR